MRYFIIAMECEAACVRPYLKGDDRLVVCGIGKVNAAAATATAIAGGATEIWNVGVCGGFGDVEVGDIYGVESACEYDFDLAKINGVAVGVLDGFDTPYISMAKPAALVGDAAFPWFKGWRILATGDRFNDSDADNDLIVNGLGASLRDMEGAAIAHVCKNAWVKCSSIKCVTDVAGRGSMTGQYMDNRARCVEKLAAAMGDLL